MKIYHLETKHVNRHDVDPALGVVIRRELVTKPSDIDQIVHEGKVYERQADGTFEVPGDVGEFLLSHRTGNGQWFSGENPFVESAEEEAPKAVVRSTTRKPR